jgi:hypothetical protein
MKKYLFTLVFIFGFLSVASVCNAASLDITDSGTHVVGDLFTLNVNVSTVDGEFLNTIEAKIKFESDKMRVISIREEGLMDVWPEKASYSNPNGTISFLGVVYNPGFTGKSGKVLSVTFKALDAGDAPISFTSASVLANDGLGTEILTASNGTNIHITEAPHTKTPITVTSTATTTLAPASTTQPLASTTETRGLLDVLAEPAPPITPTNSTFSISYDFIDMLGIFLLAVSIVVVVFILLWYMWNRMHRTRRRFLRHIASTDQALHAELIELHKALRDEVKRLKLEKEARQLTMEEKRILKRFSYLVEKTEHIMAAELYSEQL